MRTAFLIRHCRWFLKRLQFTAWLADANRQVFMPDTKVYLEMQCWERHLDRIWLGLE